MYVCTDIPHAYASSTVSGTLVLRQGSMTTPCLHVTRTLRFGPCHPRASQQQVCLVLMLEVCVLIRWTNLSVVEMYFVVM